jgi:hypothetical protein
MWRDYVPVVQQQVIVADYEFYTVAAEQFTISIVDDESDKWEKPYETVLEEPFAKQVINGPEDLIGFFLHIASHQRCDLFWQQCPVPMEQFKPHQLDLIEEVYNQRLVSVVAPSYYDAFPSVNALYDQYKGFNVAKRRPLQTMFNRVCDTGNRQFNVIHHWLYGNDPLSQQTFNTYMKFWSMCLKDNSHAEAIDAYEA